MPRQVIVAALASVVMRCAAPLAPAAPATEPPPQSAHVVVAHGSAKPIVDNGSAAGRAHNRRVQFHVEEKQDL